MSTYSTRVIGFPDATTSEPARSAHSGFWRATPRHIVRAKVDAVGRNCPYCRFPMKEGAEITVCPTCGSQHHTECWNDNRGCAITACASGPGFASAPPSESQAQRPLIPSTPSTPRAHPPTVGHAPPGGPAHDRVRNGALFVSLLAILVLGVALAFVIGSNNSHGTTTTELVKTDTPNTSSVRIASRGPTQGASTVTLSRRRAQSTGSLQFYSGSDFSMMIPSGWVQGADERPLGEEVESKWSNAADSGEYILLDVHTPTPHITMHEGAEPVREELAGQSGYTQIYYGTGDLSRHSESWMWIFEVEGSKRIDYFFRTCSNTVGLLGSASPSRFNELRGMFREVADSFRSSCE
jgi:hypothetical protein